jgi:CheY-like chemotaxis protein
VSDLKALARQGEDRVEPIDVENTLQWAIGVTMPEIRLRARLVRDFDPMPMVRGDEARLGQVFVNILLNAAQAIPPGRPQDHEIRIRAGRRGMHDRRVFVEVLDTGAGIRDEHMRRIFDPFFTTKPRGIGTGLGLSICHEIVASMRGSLTAENRPKGGAKFVVELPAHVVQPNAVPPPRTRPPPDVKTARILVIDDEALAAKALARILREHQVEIADHAPTGLQLALENRFDVIFCDLRRPDLTGLAVHEAVSQKCPGAAQRMIFVTGGTFTDEASSFAARHASRCLFKPFDTSLVRNAIAHLLSEQGAA